MVIDIKYIFVLSCAFLLPLLCAAQHNESDQHRIDSKSKLVLSSPNPKDGLFPFALKTNLLFDLVSAINAQIEIPIAKRWSVSAELIFPWWLLKKQQICLQLLSGNIEGRYWFGDVQSRKLLTGWFAGVYVGAGFYDLQWKTRGYQGEFFIASGLSGGYSHSIGRNLRLEYSLGVGYMQTHYKEYVPINDGEILSWQKDGNYTWIGPTRVNVSLVWMLDYKKIKNLFR